MQNHEHHNPHECKSSILFHTKPHSYSKVVTPMPILIGAQGHDLHPLWAHQHKHQKNMGYTCILKDDYQNSNPLTSIECTQIDTY
jgi:hypothetical protein